MMALQITSPLAAAFVGCVALLTLGALYFAVAWMRQALMRDEEPRCARADALRRQRERTVRAEMAQIDAADSAAARTLR